MTSVSQIAVVPDRIAPKLAGVGFAAVFTALFWVAIISLVGTAFGVTFVPGALEIVGCSIAAFLAAVCSPLMLRDAF